MKKFRNLYNFAQLFCEWVEVRSDLSPCKDASTFKYNNCIERLSDHVICKLFY